MIMTVKEFENNYDLHDSDITGIKFNKEKNSLEMLIDFLFWRQVWYHPNELPNGKIKVTFDDVSYVKIGNYDIEKQSELSELDIEILTSVIDANGNLKLQVVSYKYSNGTSVSEWEQDIFYIKIKAKSVKVTEIDRYKC